MLNETTLINKANIWQSNDEWKLETCNQSINIENMSNHTVLAVENFDTVIEEEFDQYKFEEAWIKGESDFEGFFTLTHMKSKKVLTAISAQILKVIGELLKIFDFIFLRLYIRNPYAYVIFDFFYIVPKHMSKRNKILWGN